MQRSAETVSKTSRTATAQLLKRKSAGDYTPSGKRYGPSDRDKARTVYARLDLTPPAAVRQAAKQGLKLRQRNEQRKELPKGDPDRLAASASLGGLEIGVQRAAQLASGEPMAPRDIRRMARYFARKASDPKRPGFGDTQRPTPAYVSWLLWGGDAGRAWAERMVKKMDRAEKREDRREVVEAVRRQIAEVQYHNSFMPGLGALDPCGMAFKGRPPTEAERRRARIGCTKPYSLSPWLTAVPTRKSQRVTVESYQDEFSNIKTALSSNHNSVSFWIYLSSAEIEGIPTIVLGKLSVPEALRGQGLAKKFMSDLIKYADMKKFAIELTPDPIGDKNIMSKSALTKFYKSFGFIDNKGKNKTFATRNTMYRLPMLRS